MKIKLEYELDSCDDCDYYEYIRCHGSDCTHGGAPLEKGDEPLAENRDGDFPKWCPLLKYAVLGYSQ